MLSKKRIFGVFIFVCFLIKAFPINAQGNQAVFSGQGSPMLGMEVTREEILSKNPKLFWNHADMLGSTRIVTDQNGRVAEEASYKSFGDITKEVVSDSHREQRKFTGHEFDPETNYTYAKARYLDTEAGRFLSEDQAFWELPASLLEDPQQMNSYAYARGNPLRYVDPDGKLNIAIPGTWAADNVMSNPKMKGVFSQYFADFQKLGGGNTNYIYSGTLGDNEDSRSAAAETIMKVIQAHQFAPGETLNIVSHSHGGNVAALLSHSLDRPIDNLVTLGTPIRPDYTFNEANIGKHIQGYSTRDGVQRLGGGQLKMSAMLFGAGGSLLCGPACLIAEFMLGQSIGVGEFGPAGRTINNTLEATDIDVTNEAGGNMKTAHGNLWRAPGVREFIHKYVTP